MAKTPLFKCTDKDGNDYILNIDWGQCSEKVKKELDRKKKEKKKDNEQKDI